MNLLRGFVLLLAGMLAWPPLERRVAAAADALIAHLSLLFVPAGVGVFVHLGRLEGAGAWRRRCSSAP